MTKHRDLDRGQVLPASLLDALQEFVSTAAPNFRIEKATATSLRVPASADNGQVGIGINGRWRYVTADVTAAHPGGTAGDFDVYVTASDNSFSETPAPDTDNTDYSFGLAIRALASPPATALYRLVGTCGWDGAAITYVSTNVSGGLRRHAAEHVAGGIDAISGLTKAQLVVAVQEALHGPGDLKASAVRYEPAGWLRCDGRAVSRTTYAALWDELRKDATGALTASSVWGNGDGSTTFNLPDFRGRALVGADNMGSAAGAAGRTTAIGAVAAVAGAATHTLTVNESPTHSHGDGTLTTASAGAHTHTYPKEGAFLAASGTFRNLITDNGTVGSSAPTFIESAGTHSHDVTGSTGTAGGGGSHNNLQPSAGASVLIKT